MSNDLYNSLNGNNSFISRLRLLKSNPAQFLAQMGLNLPQNFQGGPRDIVQYFLNTGKVSQSQVNQTQNKFNQMQHMR